MDKFAIPKKNFFYILAGVLAMVLGYILLSGGGAESPEVFNHDLFSVRRMFVAPLFILAGFVVIIVGILKKR